MEKFFDTEKKSLTHRVANFAVYRPWTSIILGLLLLFGLSYGGKNIKVDFSYRVWFDEKDQNLVQFDAFERKFGNDDNMVIVVDTKNGVFNNKTLKMLRSFTEQMWLVKQVIRVESLTNYQWTHSKGDDIIVEDFIPEEDTFEKKFLKEREKIALQDEVIPGFLVTKDLNTALIYARIKPVFGKGPNYKELMDGTRKLLEKFEKDKDYSFYITGSGAIGNTFSEVAQSDLRKMLPFLFFSLILFLLFIFKRVSGVLLPFLVIFASIMTTFGVSGFLGLKLNNLTTMIPNILIAICMADSVHLMVTFFQLRGGGIERKEAVYKAIIKNLFPIFMTSFSTSIGFFSLINTNLIPIKNLGLLAGIGTQMGLIFTFLLMAPLLSLVPINIKAQKMNNQDEASNLPKEWSLRAISFYKKFDVLIIAIFVLVFGSSLYLAYKNEVNANPYDYFSDDVPLKKANDFVLKKLGGTGGPEIVIESGSPEGIKSPDFLNKVEKLQSWIDSNPRVNKTVSVVNILKSMNRSLNGGDQQYYKIPETKKGVAEQLFLYTMSLPQGMDINNRVTLDNSEIRLSILWDLLDSKTSLETIEKIEKKANEIGLKAYATGKLPLYQRMDGYVVKTFFSSITMALILVTVLLIVIFKSFKFGLLSLIPNVYPLVLGAGAMQLMGKNIDLGTALVTSVCLGIAVDDTIHFLTNLNRRLKKSNDLEYCLAQVLTFTGPALIFTTIILVAGFGVLAFADFVPNYNFGVLSVLVLITALITDLVLLPAVLIRLDKNKKGRKA
ncbi:MAG: hypothetical protein CME68_07400 [Halobacteriovoraceae bacterium]|nr:hypothetical protein [Halobacteriovoraceae bacterium]